MSPARIYIGVVPLCLLPAHWPSGIRINVFVIRTLEAIAQTLRAKRLSIVSDGRPRRSEGGRRDMEDSAS